jgi:hypothetical protein
MLRVAAPFLALVWLTTSACVPAVRRSGSAPTPAQMAELWVDPGTAPRDLFAGPPANRHVRPATDSRFSVVKRDTGGFSITYRVRDDRGREWSVKLGPEAQPEVVASRILWGVGYHAVPSFFVERWIAVDRAKGAMLGGSRFRPMDMGLKPRGEWSWQENPFVGTREYGGLLALMMILNSTDLKNQNNAMYDVVGEPREQARRWFVVKDVGASLGETGRMDPRRGYIDGFEREPFITGVENGFAVFAFRGRHQELIRHVRIADVRWVCERLQTLTERQWRDAFRAGHYSDEITARYVARIREKIAQGLELR